MLTFISFLSHHPGLQSWGAFGGDAPPNLFVSPNLLCPQKFVLII